MKLAKCEKGHYYDKDKYSKCPFCNPDILNDDDEIKCSNGHYYNKRKYTHCPFCSVSIDNNKKLYIGDFYYEFSDKTLYLGIGDLGCLHLNGIEKYIDNNLSYFHYYAYDPETFRFIFSDNCTLLSKPSFLDFSDITDNELFIINELFSKRMAGGTIPHVDNDTINRIHDRIYSYMDRLFFDQEKGYDDLFQFKFLELGAAGNLFLQYHHGRPLFIDVVIVVSAFNSMDFYAALKIEHELSAVGFSHHCFVNTIIVALSDEYKKEEISILQQTDNKRLIRESIIEYELHTWFCDGEEPKYLFILPYRTKDEWILYLSHKLGILKSINIAHNYFINMKIEKTQRNDLYKEMEEILARIKIIEDISSNIQTKVTQVDDRTKEMKVLLEKIADIQSEIKSRKTIFKKYPDDDDNIEPVYRQFVDSMADTICQKLYQAEDAKVTFEENSLRGVFGDYWECLNDYTRKSLVSARVFLTGGSSFSHATLDYSGVVISATSALELELRLRFFDGYKAYLRNRFKGDYTKWPRSMVYDGRTENSLFTIGSLPGIFGSRQRDNNGKRFYNKKMYVTPAEKNLLNDYLKTILYSSGDDIDTFFKTGINGLDFLDRCEDVRCLYRNSAAHTDSLSIEEAAACCRDIIGIDRNDAALDRNDAAQNIGQIEGLILELVKLSKIPAGI